MAKKKAKKKAVDKRTSKKAKSYNPKGRTVYQVPDGCGPLFDAVRHDLENNRANERIDVLVADFQQATAFLEGLPVSTKVGDLDTGLAMWKPTVARLIEKATGRKLLKEEED